MVDDDEDERSPSPEPRTDSRSTLLREIRAWQWLHIVKRDETFSLFFSPPNRIYGVAVEVGGASWGPRDRGHAPHPHGQGVGPLAFIFCQYFLYFPKLISVDFQVIPRTFVFYTINNTMAVLLKTA